MSRTKYFSWTDEKRAELREFVDTHEQPKNEALIEAAELFGVSIGSCHGAYNYEPKKPIVVEVDPEDLEPRKERAMTNRKTKEVSIKQLMEELKEPNTKTYKLKIDIHNDVNNECLVIHVNDSVTILKIGEVIVTLEV
jgi:hypothetical protein